MATLWSCVRPGVALASCLGATLAVVVPAIGACERPPNRGVTIAGQRVAEADIDAWLAERARNLAATRVRLVHEMQVFSLSAADLGIDLDVLCTKQRAAEVRAGCDRFGRLLPRCLASAPPDVQLCLRADVRRSQLGLAHVAQQIERRPRDARLDLDGRRVEPSVIGWELDYAATIEAAAQGLAVGQDTFALAVREVPPSILESHLPAVDVTKVCGSFETRFVLWGDGVGRAVNIARAAKMLDGTVLEPGKDLSFNGAVGPRTVDRGFTYAPEIVGDEMQTGVGGGVCQVASTLHAAATFAALTIEERWAHARPATYIPMGLDATVSYPSKDLRLRNALPVPVVLHVSVPEPGLLRAEVLGADSVAKVSHRYGIARSEPFERRLVRKNWLGSGRALRHQKGIRGFSVMSVVRTEYGDGRVVERSYASEYRPVPEIFWLSPDYDEGRLPAVSNAGG